MSIYSTLPSPGELNRRILIRQWADVPNVSFGIDQTFDAGITRWAKKDPIHGLQIRMGAQTAEVPTDLFFVRAGTGTRPEDITTTHVVEFNGRRYRVLDAIDVNGAGEYTRITAKDLGVIA